MGRVRSLQIAGYRSVRDDILVLFPENTPIVLVGENNSGKSNIVRALDLVLGESWTWMGREPGGATSALAPRCPSTPGKEILYGHDVWRARIRRSSSRCRWR